ncbi:uncharacterized protein TRIADDRAFT_57849 [Trichoplax adhaerens]|uniref:Uncharacterized protein n=1 Tax=Trichoplax adhaerens TaxID=10228 RepID=B3S1Q8_TRIAD|nr:predicted protein [Trichoplax adhaerens]EDV23337.1 predicted protein [Trichoplax adhaerens]|eukprot:XP_002114247.1 predicted protein [Trichoplax adhaerens]
MKITKQLLRSQVGCRLVDAVYIDLSDRQLVSLENLSVCPKLQTILASQNDIDAILTTIIRCRELWKIDLSCNRLFFIWQTKYIQRCANKLIYRETYERKRVENFFKTANSKRPMLLLLDILTVIIPLDYPYECILLDSS